VGNQTNLPRKGEQGFRRTGRKPSRAPAPGYRPPLTARAHALREDIPNFGFLYRSMQDRLARQARESEEQAEPRTTPEATPGERVIERLREGEVPMWMTAEEIESQFAPLENDRLYWYEDGRGSPAHDETDQEFWDRKLRESRGAPRRLKFPVLDPDGSIPPAPSQESPGFAYPESDGSDARGALYESLQAEGVQEAVSLQHPDGAGEERPQVLGGGHRVAAMKDIAPDALIPVRFFDDMRQAQDELGDSY
jgi:hypothetical protein